MVGDRGRNELIKIYPVQTGSQCLFEQYFLQYWLGKTSLTEKSEQLLGSSPGGEVRTKEEPKRRKGAQLTFGGESFLTQLEQQLRFCAF